MRLILYRAIRTLFTVIEVAILARAFISWLPVPRNNKFIILLYRITEPILGPIRSLILRSSFGSNLMFDFSPIIALVLLAIIRSILLSILF